MLDIKILVILQVLPEKPDPPREAAETIPRAHETSEEQEEERTRADKGDDERSKGSYSGKPARAVGVAHPFNAEKSEGEFALGMVGSITTGRHNYKQCFVHGENQC